MKEDFVNKVSAFLNAQKIAEENGEDTFICPICGNTALWARAEINNHLHCTCTGCGMMMVE